MTSQVTTRNTLKHIRAFSHLRERRRRRYNATRVHESQVAHYQLHIHSEFYERFRLIPPFTQHPFAQQKIHIERKANSREALMWPHSPLATRHSPLFAVTIPLPCQKLRVEIIKGRGNNACGRAYSHSRERRRRRCNATRGQEIEWFTIYILRVF